MCHLSPCLHIFLGGAALTEAAPKCGGRDMRTDNDFQPRLGRIRARGGKASKRYLARLYASMEKARPGVFARRGRTREPQLAALPRDRSARKRTGTAESSFEAQSSPAVGAGVLNFSFFCYVCQKRLFFVPTLMNI